MIFNKNLYFKSNIQKLKNYFGIKNDSLLSLFLSAAE